MTTYLPKDVQDGLAASLKGRGRCQSRLRLHAGGRDFPITRLWESGLALDAERTPVLRGLVDIYDGSRHLCQCLVVASGGEAGELRFEFKRITAVAERPARDFAAP